MELDFVTLDVFSETRYAGNQLAIVTVPKEKRDDVTQEKKQKMAQEFNLSESVILQESQDSNKSWDIGIFMVDTELPFAGHPTVGSACYVCDKFGVTEGVLNTKAGKIPFKKASDGSVLAQIPFAYNLHHGSMELSRLQTVGFKVDSSSKISFPVASIVNGLGFCLVELESLEELSKVDAAGVEVPLDLMDEGWKSRAGFYFFVRTGEKNGIVTIQSRMCLGNLEDPCTGSAACTLSSYLTLADKKPEQEYEITQGVEMKRPGVIKTKVYTDNAEKISKIELGGASVSVMSGRITI